MTSSARCDSCLCSQATTRGIAGWIGQPTVTRAMSAAGHIKFDVVRWDDRSVVVGEGAE